MKRPKVKKDENTKALTGGDVARLLGVSYGMAAKLPIPRFEFTVGNRTFRRYKEQEVLDYIDRNTKVV